MGGLWYYVLDDDDLDWPVWYPAELFEIVDGAIPSDWRVGTRATEQSGLRLILSFPEWVNQPSYYEKLVDGQPSAVVAFEAQRRFHEGY